MVSRHIGLEIVGETDFEGMLHAVAATTPDVVVLGNAAGEGAPPLEPLRVPWPTLRVITIDHDGRSATAYEPNAPPQRIDEVSPATLLEMMRIPLH
jgi:hypothetical protein